jgi:hypothetical protein
MVDDSESAETGIGIGPSPFRVFDPHWLRNPSQVLRDQVEFQEATVGIVDSQVQVGVAQGKASCEGSEDLELELAVVERDGEEVAILVSFGGVVAHEVAVLQFAPDELQELLPLLQVLLGEIDLLVERIQLGLESAEVVEGEWLVH